MSNTPSQHPRRHFTFLVPRLGFEGSYLSDGTQALPQGLGRLTWASSFQLQSTTSLLLSGLLSADLSTIHSTLPAGRKKKKTKPSYRLSIRGTHVNTHRRKNTLAPPIRGHSGHFRAPSRTPASFPGFNLAICSPRPTLSGAEQFQSELQIKQSKLFYNHLILMLLAIIGKKSKSKKALVLALSLMFS